MSEHTPTPWIVRTQVRVGPYRGGHYLARNDTESATAWAKDEANAAFIVKAVNSHDALVKAMETARRLIGAINDTAPPAVKESNINMAWHVLDDNLRALASLKEPA